MILALWSLTLAPVRRALRPRALLRFLAAAADPDRRPRSSSPALAFLALFGPFGFGSSFSKVAGSNTYGPVSPIEALGDLAGLELPARRRSAAPT